MRRLGEFAFLLLFTVLAFAPAAHAQRRVALVIGNSAYEHTAPLPNPKNDAIDVGAALKKHGFEVIEGFDLDKAGMDRKVRDFAEAVRGAPIAVFFFAGHGLQVSGHNYLVPIDAKLATTTALDWEAVRLDLVHRSMEREAATNILFIDACRNNPLARNLARAMGTRSVELGHGLAQVEAGIGTLVSFSTQPGNVALDGKGRNSPFAGALAKHVASSRDDLSAILIAVRNDVMQETEKRQVPWEHSALTGRFYFGLGPPAAAGSSADELSWDLIKDTKDPAQLRRFIEQFPDSKRRPDAERQAAALAAIPKTAEPPAERPKKASRPPLPPPAGPGPPPGSQAAPAPPQAAPTPPGSTAGAPSNADAEALRVLSGLVNLGVTARDVTRAKQKAAAPVAAPVTTDAGTAPGRPAAMDTPAVASTPEATRQGAQRTPGKGNATQANCQQMAQQYRAAARTAGAPGTMPQLMSMYQYLQCNCGYPPSPQLPPCRR